MSSFSASGEGKIRRGFCLLGTLVALLVGLASPALAQKRDSLRAIDFRPRFDITSVYKASSGFGIGGGLDVLNLFLPGSRLALDAYVAQHAGEYEVAFFPRDLRMQGFSGGMSAEYATHGRRAFYGLGPASTKNNKVQVETDLAAFAGHVGVRRGRIGLISTLRYRTGTLGSFQDDIDNAFSRLDAASAARLTRDRGARVSGVSLGATTYYDGRDHPEVSERGVLLAAGMEGFLDTEATAYDHLQFHASAMLFVPVTNDVTVILRGFALHTEPLSDALPLLLLPRLSHRLAVGPGSGRFTGNDLLLFDVQAHHPVPNLHPDIATDGFIVVGAYNAYENLFTDARLTPSWAEKFEPGGRYPLRAAAGVGIRAYDPEKRDAILTGALGLSADGFTVATLTFTLDPHRLRTPWRW